MLLDFSILFLVLNEITLATNFEKKISKYVNFGTSSMAFEFFFSKFVEIVDVNSLLKKKLFRVSKLTL